MATRFRRVGDRERNVVASASWRRTWRGTGRRTQLGLVPPATLSDVVAIVGCDGTGKTTLVADLIADLAAKRPTERHYMGLVSGEFGDRIKRLPLLGTWLEAYLARRVRRAQDMRQTLPGTASAIVMYGFSLWRMRKLNRVVRRAQNGVRVIAERYPQAQAPGFHYDGPGLSIERTNSRLARRLALREQQLYERMAQLRPSLVIRLTIDAEIAFARKPDHPLAELRDKVEAMSRIDYGGAPVQEIDAGLPYPQVYQAVLAAVERATARR